MKKYLPIIAAIFLIACKPIAKNTVTSIDIQNLPGNTYVKDSGNLLISQPFGLLQIKGGSASIDSTLIITVHGYKSEGYEWIDALKNFANKYSKLYFYRYDWNKCPNVIGKNLAELIDSLLVADNSINDIKIFGHSYGGLVVTYCAGFLQTDIPADVYTIASPLRGYPIILDSCDLQYDDQNILQYALWNDNVAHHQWRTQKEFDGAYRDLDYDPQNIDLYNSIVTNLPDSMDGHRLGHNWSVTWVTDYILKNE